MRFYFTALFILSSICCIAQPVTFSPDTVLYGQAITNEYREYQIDMNYGGSDTLSLSWRLVGNSIPTGWNWELCDFGQCYTTPPNTGTMAPISGSDFGYLKVILNPYEVEGSGTLSYWVYETGDMDNYTTVHFHISTDAVTSVLSPERAATSIYPNPNNGQFVIQSTTNAPLTFSIFTPTGKLLRQGTTTQPVHALDLSGFASGMYYIRLLQGATPSIHTLIIE